ncbi:hypothetical protein BKA70DRAFT_1255598 [Coprinopsis sp. MPI-PUGE-AT-0042]|nr:hypothetical protein BKA70DRAFT_1255598 [Coprinopsis sp. MPI-PUGE-AT-0042]
MLKPVKRQRWLKLLRPKTSTSSTRSSTTSRCRASEQQRSSAGSWIGWTTSTWLPGSSAYLAAARHGSSYASESVVASGSQESGQPSAAPTPSPARASPMIGQHPQQQQPPNPMMQQPQQPQQLHCTMTPAQGQPQQQTLQVPGQPQQPQLPGRFTFTAPYNHNPTAMRIGTPSTPSGLCNKCSNSSISQRCNSKSEHLGCRISQESATSNATDRNPATTDS